MYTKLRDISTKLKSELKVANNAYLSALADKLQTNPKDIKSNQKDDTGIPTIANDGNIIKEDKSKAQVFIKYFHSVFTKPCSIAIYDIPTRLPEMEIIAVSRDGVEAFLFNLNRLHLMDPMGFLIILPRLYSDEEEDYAGRHARFYQGAVKKKKSQ